MGQISCQDDEDDRRQSDLMTNGKPVSHTLTTKENFREFSEKYRQRIRSKAKRKKQRKKLDAKANLKKRLPKKSKQSFRTKMGEFFTRF